MKEFGRISAAGLFRSIAVFLLGIVTVLALAFAVYGYERDGVYYYTAGFDYLQLNELAGTQLICAIVCILLLAVGALAAVFAVIALLLKGKGARRLKDACGVLCVVFLCVYMVLGFVICGEREAAQSEGYVYSTTTYIPFAIGAALLVLYFAVGIPLALHGKKKAQRMAAGSSAESASAEPVVAAPVAALAAVSAAPTVAAAAPVASAAPAAMAAGSAVVQGRVQNVADVPAAEEAVPVLPAEESAKSRAVPVSRMERVRYLEGIVPTLLSYKELYDGGVLTGEEFRSFKSLLLWENCRCS